MQGEKQKNKKKEKKGINLKRIEINRIFLPLSIALNLLHPRMFRRCKNLFFQILS